LPYTPTCINGTFTVPIILLHFPVNEDVSCQIVGSTTTQVVTAEVLSTSYFISTAVTCSATSEGNSICSLTHNVNIGDLISSFGINCTEPKSDINAFAQFPKQDPPIQC